MIGQRVRSAAGRVTIRAKLVAVTSVLIVVIGGIIWLSARSTSADHERAVVDNVAGRQPMLVQDYVTQVLLADGGFSADPAGAKDLLVHDADALLDGGAVLAVQGNDDTIHLSAQTDPTVRAKLAEFRRLVDELTATGDKVLAESSSDAAYHSDVEHLEALAHVTSNVGHDAVGRMTLLADRDVTANARLAIELAALGIVLALVMNWLLGRRLVRRLRGLVEVARTAASGDLDTRFPVTSDDEVGTLGRAFNDMADSLASLLGRLEADASRDGFSSQLMEAFEMADDERETYAVVERAMGDIAATAPMELLLADSSRAHLERVAVSPTGGAAGCGVESPFSCIAVRRGRAVTFESSEALNACPKLRDRVTGPCSAVCVPVSFMGKSLGVLHTIGQEHEPLSTEQVVQLSTLASQASSRIGTVRAFSQTQLQATTDGLTGLLNRRSAENELRLLMQDGTPFALAMVDLDHFKQLNDTYGHEGGDRALRIFSRTVRDAVRSHDIVARYGGEEFLFAFPTLDAEQGAALLERMRVVLSGTLATADTPAFTASFGVVDSSAARNLEDLIRLADEALMAAKAAGRDRVHIASAITARVRHAKGPAAS